MQVLIQKKQKKKNNYTFFYTRNRRKEAKKINTLPINTGDTAFMILCTAMVCLMTPGLAFFTAD